VVSLNPIRETLEDYFVQRVRGSADEPREPRHAPIPSRGVS